MYRVVARLINKGLFRSVSVRTLKQTPALAPYEAEMDDKIFEAFNEAMLSPHIDIKTFSGFITTVLRRRIVDLRHEVVANPRAQHGNRPRFISLDQPKGGEKYTLSNLAGNDDRSDTPAGNMDSAELMGQLRHFAKSLPPRQKQVFTVFLDELEGGPIPSKSKMAEKIGIDGRLFNGNLRVVLDRLASMPELRERIVEFLGETPSHISRFNERSAANRENTPHAGSLPARLPALKDMRELKDGLRKLFQPEEFGRPLSQTDLAEESGIPNYMLSILMGEHNNGNPKTLLTDENRKILSAQLRKMGREEKISELEDIFAEMRLKTDYADKPGRKRDLPEGHSR